MTHVSIGENYNNVDILIRTSNEFGDHNLMYGLGGDDYLSGEEGFDTLYGDRLPTSREVERFGNEITRGRELLAHPEYAGEPGNDQLYGGLGSDKLYGDGGDDWLNGGVGDDALDGGDGFDFIDYSSASGGVSVDLYDPSVNTGSASGADGNDRITAVEGIFGSNFDDVLEGENNANRIYGNGGKDFLDGGIGSDFLDGGDGNDTVVGGSEDDELYGGIGDDNMYGGFDNDYLDGWEGNDRLEGDYGNDVLVAWKGADTLYGGEGHDWLDGSYDNDILYGGGGDDILGNSVVPEPGDDRMYGESGNDSLFGGDGKDTLVGGFDKDSLTGGAGQDKFVFMSKNEVGTTNAFDTINDFSVIDDTIQVSKAGFGGLVSGASITSDQFYIGSGAHDSSDRFIYNRSIGALYFDKDGTGSTAKVQIAQLSTGLSLTRNDIYVIA